MSPAPITLCDRILKVEAGTVPVFLTALETAGCHVTHIDDDPTGIPPPGQWLILFGNAAWYPKVRSRLLALPPTRRPWSLLWHSEPLPPACATGLPNPWLDFREIAKILLRDARATDVYTNFSVLREFARAGVPDVLVLSSRGRQEFLADHGIHGHFAPLGYDPGMGRDLNTPRDLDAVFLGIPHMPRRRRLLRALERANINLVQAGSWSDPAFWGENRTRLLNRAKILINFARTPSEFSGYRLTLGMANKALVVSEPIYRPEPFEPGRHFIMAPIEEMADLIRYFLDHEDERRGITEVAYPFVTQAATRQRSTQLLVSLMKDHEKLVRT